MNKIYTSLTAFASLILVSSCGSDLATIYGNEDVETYNVTVNAIDEIELAGNFNVTVHPSNTYKVDIVAESNLYSAIAISEENGVLKISHKNNITLLPSNDIAIEIYTPSLSRIKTSGASDIHFKEQILSNETFVFESAGSTTSNLKVKANSVTINNAGAGDITITGQANEVFIKSSGAASIDAGRLIAFDATMALSGAGSGTVYASKKLKATISGVGSITYLGNPINIEKKVKGMGNISAE